MDEELALANQRIDEMSFKDLTARAAAAMKPKPAETVKPPANENEPKAPGTDAPEKPKTS
jgi:hypothetical protein